MKTRCPRGAIITVVYLSITVLVRIHGGTEVLLRWGFYNGVGYPILSTGLHGFSDMQPRAHLAAMKTGSPRLSKMHTEVPPQARRGHRARHPFPGSLLQRNIHVEAYVGKWPQSPPAHSTPD